MSDQDFRERVLSSIEDLRRTTERIENRIEQINEGLSGRLTVVEKDITNLHGDVRWIRGKLAGRQEATSSQDARLPFG